MSGRADAVGNAPLLVTLDRRSREPLLRQLYASIRESVLAGRLKPGTRLPPTRVLADDLGVSRTIVVMAYQQLVTEGFVIGRGSAGSFIARLEIPRAPRITQPTAPVAPTRRTRTLIDTGSGLELLKPAPVPFRIGEPALDLFPARLWARLRVRRSRRSGGSLMGYGNPAGLRALRVAIAGYVGAARGVNATGEQVILTRGTQQAIDLVSRVLLEPGDGAWVEDPGYLAARALLQHAGAVITPVPVDDEGIDVIAGERAAPGARLAYVSPSHQFPLGTTMSLRRRLALLDWAHRASAWIVEDDFDSEFRFTGPPIASLQGLDERQRVIYVGTFSKTVFPALRLGYVIAPPSLVDLLRRAQAMFDHVAPTVEQATLAEFIQEGHFARHVRRMRSAYADRQDALLRAAALELPDLLDAVPADTGMHVIGWLRDTRLDDDAIARRARNAGVEVSPLSMYCVRAVRPPALLLGFAAIRPPQMRSALATLREAIEGEARRKKRSS